MNLLILDKNHPFILENLQLKGCTITEDYTSIYEDICDKISNFQGIILRSRIPIDKNLINQATQLQFIARVGAGMENIDKEYAESKGILLINAAEGNADSVAEHCVGMLLSLIHRIRISDREVRNNIWLREENRGDELMGKTVGILGYGTMGKAFAKRLIGFGVHVICFDILPNVGDDFATQLTENEFFSQTQILSIHLPLDKSTLYLINAEYINQFVHPIYLINSSRGKIVHTPSLIHSIENEKIVGACLDVFEYENPSFETLDYSNELHYLQQSDKLILTPHIAGWSMQSDEKMARIIVEKIIDIFLKN